ncbi:MAG: response regulator [Cyclobacteriaceae bacterium]|nr:response regulator [Cyclobacteriaceae bacterium]
MKKILLIEDNPDVRENTAEILSLANYDVHTAENGKVGIELASKEKPDLIICDIMMPELDGYGVLHILSKKPETASIPFIFLTAKTEKADIRKGMTLGADDYLTKPFDDTDLLNAVEARLNKISLLKKQYAADASGLDQFIEDAQRVLNLNDLAKDRKVKTYKKKTGIYMEGELPNNLYFVKSGNVKSFRTNADGKELIISLYKEGDFFGYEAILENNNYGESAMALEDSELTVIPRHDFLTLLHGHPEISRTFVSMLCKKIAEKEAQLLNLAYNSVRQRTAEALLKIHTLKEKDVVSISRDDLAKMVGTASESVIRVLSDFREEGIISIDGGKINVLHPHKLEQVVKWNVARG